MIVQRSTLDYSAKPFIPPESQQDLPDKLSPVNDAFNSCIQITDIDVEQNQP